VPPDFTNKNFLLSSNSLDRYKSTYPIKYRNKLSKRCNPIILLSPLFPAFSLGSHTAFAIIVIISGKIAQ
jgi:hypothetical protein